MTKEEKELFNNLNRLLEGIKQENQKFREDVTKKVDGLAAVVDKKHLPITLEQNILSSAQQAIDFAIKESLSRHDSPLMKLVKSVVEENSVEFKSLINDSFLVVIRTEEFKVSIMEAFRHKIAKIVVNNTDGLLDKVANELKQDSVFKSKLTLLVSGLVDETIKQKKI